jgi:16S rRNA (guanine527-N7)-methyltransferase
MHPERIAELLRPFLAAGSGADVQSRQGRAQGESDAGRPAALSSAQLEVISIYIDMLLRWNARINLTAVRQPEEIVTRHFGESFFAARRLFPAPMADSQPPLDHQRPTTITCVIDVGSGAGFPGLPIKIWAPQVHLTLIESNQKKATFLKEVARALTLTDIDVMSTRAESFSGQAEIVTLRAVERFENVLPIAVRLVVPGGRLALLVGERQVQRARQFGNMFRWSEPLRIPLSSNRVLLLGSKEPT